MGRGESPLRKIEALRKWRVRGERDLTVRADLERAVREARKSVRATGGLEEKWGGVVPANLAAVTRPGRVSRGVLTVLADNASARYMFEKWLAGDGLEAVQAAAKSVKRVKVVL